MGGRGGSSMSGQMGHAHRARSAGVGMLGVDTEDTALVGAAGGSGSDNGFGHGHGHRHGLCGGGFLMNLLGFDRFTRGRAVNGLARAGKASNPFDMGVLGNCRDFWGKGSELGVEYELLYDVPVEGFREARRRKEEEEGAAGIGVGEAGRKRKGFLGMGMGMGFGRGGSAAAGRAGYEPVSQTQV